MHVDNTKFCPVMDSSRLAHDSLHGVMGGVRDLGRTVRGAVVSSAGVLTHVFCKEPQTKSKLWIS